jgi:tetratricopeptide (TPR) repeat protein
MLIILEFSRNAASEGGKMLRNFKLALLPAIVVGMAGCAGGGMALDAAQRLESSGDYSGAINNYDTLIKEKPSLVTGYLGKGRCLLKMNEPKDAEQIFRDAVKVDGRSIEAKLALANVLEARKDYMETKIQLDDAYLLDPKNLLVVEGQAVELEEEGKAKEAVDKYKEALVIDPTNIDVHTKLAHAYGVLNDFDNAKKELAEVDKIKLLPKK